MAVGTGSSLLAGRYRVDRLLGRGGMAAVYLARDEQLDRQVAVKRLHTESPDDATRRFAREAKLGASLNHPNLVWVFDAVADDEGVLIVMEYVPGTTLRRELDLGPVMPRRAAEVIKGVAAALDHAHEQGVIHRDVKPANVLLSERGAVKLADLGIATAAEHTRITRSGVVLGTASYLAPEQLEGKRPTAASDIYSLATVAFEALTGVKARRGNTPFEIAHAITSQPAPDLRDEWQRAPEEAAEVLKRGMARDPADRPASAGELAEELEKAFGRESARRHGGRFAREEPTAPPPVPPPVRRRRISPLLPLGLLAALLLVAGFLALMSGGGDDDPASERADRPAPREQREPTRSQPQQEAEPSEPAPAPAPAPTNPAPEPPQQGSSEESASASELNDQGYSLMQQGRYDAAIPVLQRAVDRSSGLTQAYALYNLGRSLRLAGRPREAIPILERRLRIPNQTETVRRELNAARRAAR
jgi:eukaryotic-like serine/threonine-protein kinase